MLCYRDKTFCSFYKECKEGNHCHRALTDFVIQLANREELRICKFAQRPTCFKSFEESEE